MSYVTWLPNVLRDAGVPVYVMPGAQSRSTWTSGFGLDAIIWHHTATSTAWLDGHVALLLRDGRRDLSGPLSQVGVERDGTWVVVAMGRANHNGYGRHGNDSLGLEFYNNGLGEPYPEAQVNSGIRGIAAIQNYLNRPVPLLGHKESDPARKIDPLLNMNHIRTRVQIMRALLPSEEDEDMIAELIKVAYNLARRENKDDFYDVAIHDPVGYAYHLVRAYQAGDPIAYVRNNVAAPLAKKHNRKINI